MGEEGTGQRGSEGSLLIGESADSVWQQLHSFLKKSPLVHVAGLCFCEEEGEEGVLARGEDEPIML